MDTKMLKYTTFFSGTFTLSEANKLRANSRRKSCLVIHYLWKHLSTQHVLCALVPRHIQGPVLVWRHAVCLDSQNEAHRLRFWQNTGGAFNAVQSRGRRMLNLLHSWIPRRTVSYLLTVQEPPCIFPFFSPVQENINTVPWATGSKPGGPG